MGCSSAQKELEAGQALENLWRTIVATQFSHSFLEVVIRIQLLPQEYLLLREGPRSRNERSEDVFILYSRPTVIFVTNFLSFSEILAVHFVVPIQLFRALQHSWPTGHILGTCSDHSYRLVWSCPLTLLQRATISMFFSWFNFADPFVLLYMRLVYYHIHRSHRSVWDMSCTFVGPIHMNNTCEATGNIPHPLSEICLRSKNTSCPRHVMYSITWYISTPRPSFIHETTIYTSVSWAGCWCSWQPQQQQTGQSDQTMEEESARRGDILLVLYSTLSYSCSLSFSFPLFLFL